MRSYLPPYFHPTTICFVDDNYSFLRSLAADFPEHMPVATFLDPETALTEINKPAPPALVDRCFSMDRQDPSRPIIHLNLAVLEQEIKLIERFQRVSVLMVDYAMPTMDGLEFCAQVQNPSIIKVLLTGVADEKTAVAAFNRGIIDRYLPKAQLGSNTNLIDYAEELEHAYFEQYTKRLSVNLALNPPAFMTDSEVLAHFSATVAQHNIIEYYLVSGPYGYLMLRADGSVIRWVVLSARELSAQVELAERFDAPAEHIEGLRQGRLVGFFYERPEDYLGHEAYPWQEMLLPAQILHGDQSWFVGVAEHPPTDIDFDPAQTSYNSFLKHTTA